MTQGTESPSIDVREDVAIPNGRAAEATPEETRTGLWWYAPPIAVGTLLILWAAWFQPYHQNELLQISTYGADSFSDMVGATKPPPELDQILGGYVQHLLGPGDLRQRLVELLAGIGTLLFTAGILRRLRLGPPGTVGLWFLALSPLFIRYSAYARPYSVPLMLMVAFVYVVLRWHDRPRWGWLLAVGIVAAALPLARVTESSIFLALAAVSLLIQGLWKRMPWARVWPILAVIAGALLAVALPLTRIAEAEFGETANTNPLAAITDVGPQATRLFTFFPQVLALVFPWWPLVLAAVLTAFVVPVSRRAIVGWWATVPLLGTGLLWAIVFHLTVTANPDSGFVYRDRMAYFFVPGVSFVLAFLAAGAAQIAGSQRVLGRLLFAVPVVAVVSQLPMTFEIATTKQEPDWQIGAAIVKDEPRDAFVVFDHPRPPGAWRQKYYAYPRYLNPENRRLASVSALGPIEKEATRPGREVGDINVVLLDWDPTRIRFGTPPPVDMPEVAGWTMEVRDRFVVYRPEEPTRGVEGLLATLDDFRDALGPDDGFMFAVAKASLLAELGRTRAARAAAVQILDDVSPEAAPAVYRRMQGEPSLRRILRDVPEPGGVSSAP
jgi:hypothetical protein